MQVSSAGGASVLKTNNAHSGDLMNVHAMNRRRQFTIRHVFLMVLMIGAGLAVLRDYWTRYHVAARLNSIGAIVEYSYEQGPSKTSPVPEFVNRLVGSEVLNSVFSIDLTGSSATDADVAAIVTAFPELESLSLDFTNVSDRAVDDLVNLPGLKSLGLSHSEITDDGIQVIKNCTSLQSLSIDATRITDACVSSLSQMTGLKELTIGQTLITRQGFESLRSKLIGCHVADTLLPFDFDDPQWQRAPGREY